MKQLQISLQNVTLTQKQSQQYKYWTYTLQFGVQIYFANAFCVILRTSLTLRVVYWKHKPIDMHSYAVSISIKYVPVDLSVKYFI
jgi:hypothetical protein